MAPVKPLVPDHELIRCIGHGSYGDVWLARNAVGTWRAVKVVFRDRFQDPRPYEREFNGIRRFEPLSRGNEAFVDILQVGVNDAGGYFYYVMELADSAYEDRKSESRTQSPIGSADSEPTTPGGPVPISAVHASSDVRRSDYAPKTLAKVLLQRGRLPVRECLELGLALNLGLSHLHQAGLIHRDIKPSNIIFVGGVPKLADIGLVIEAAEARSFVGTEGYIPPEGPTSPQADLFSLGKVLYEAGMGRDRKDFPDPMTGLADAPDAAVMLEFNAILLKACAANVAERYHSAEEMNADLALLHSGGSVRRQRRLAGQLRIVQRAGAVVAGLAAIVALGWWWQAKQTRTVRQLVADKNRVVEDNSHRLVRLAVANGVREMDLGNAGSALRWLTDALVLTTNDPADAAVQRIRLNEVLTLQPRLLRVLPHPAPVGDAQFSPDEHQIVTACTDGLLRLWGTDGIDSPATTLKLAGAASLVRFTRDGSHLFVVERSDHTQLGQASLLEVRTGQPRFPPILNLTDAALSPDEEWLAVARADNAIELIVIRTGSVARRIAGHSDRVERIAFSPNSTVLLSASRDRTVRRWRVASGEAIGPALRHDFPVVRAVFSADGSRIATVATANDFSGPVQFQTWIVASGRPLRPPILGRGFDGLAAFDPSGRYLLTADREPAAQLWNVDTHTLVLPPLVVESRVRCFDFSPDGAYLALGGEDGTVKLWDAETGRRSFATLPQTGAVRSIRFNGEGTRLLVAGEDGTVRLWDLAAPSAARSRLFYSNVRPHVALVDGDSRMVVAARGPKRLLQVDLDSPDLDSVDLESSAAPEWGPFVVDADGRQWAHSSSPERDLDLRRGLPVVPSVVELWSHEPGAIRHLELPHPADVRVLCFHRDGSLLLTAAADRVTRFWRTADGTLAWSLPWSSEDAFWLAVSPDLRVAMTLTGDEKSWRIAFRDVASGETLRTVPETNPDVRRAAFSRDGRHVGLFGGSRSPQLWRVATAEPIDSLLNHGGRVTCLEWSPDGRRVITAGDSPEVKVWDAETGAPVLTPLRMGVRPVERARFSPDGRFIVARCDDDFIRVWDAITGEALIPALAHPDTVREVFITEHDQLVSVQNSGEIRVWNLAQASGSAVDLADYARLMNGGAPGTGGRTGAVGGEGLAAGLRTLQERRPDWFRPAADPMLRQGWDSRAPPTSLRRTEAEVFRLKYLARRFPEQSDLRDRLAWQRALLVPPRETDTPRQLLDLSRAYTHGFDMLPRGEFARFPRGTQALAGTEFDLRGLVQLDHRSRRTDAPGPFHAAMVIEVGQYCRALHFLQATVDDPHVEGAVVARWFIHYLDGSMHEWPVIYGQHVRDLWWVPGREPLEAAQATLAWRGVATIGNLPGTDGVRLLKATWRNPRPEVEISHLELRVGETSMKPLVVAVTAE